LRFFALVLTTMVACILPRRSCRSPSGSDDPRGYVRQVVVLNFGESLAVYIAPTGETPPPVLYDRTRVRTCTDSVHMRLSSEGRIILDEGGRSTGDRWDGWAKWRPSRKRIAHAAPCRVGPIPSLSLFVRSSSSTVRSFLK